MTRVSELGRHAARGARDLMIGQLARLGLQFVGLVVLSRLLDPTEFGIIAVAAVVIGLGEALRDFGLTSAAIRAPYLSAGQRDILFWASSAIGVVLAVTLLLVARPLADLFGILELASVLMVLSLVPLLNGLSAQYRANLNRTLKLQAIAIADTASALIALAIAIVFAFMGYGFWALVFQTVATSVVSLAAYVVSSPWLPRLPRRGTGSWPILKFGGQVAVSQAMSYAGSNVDVVVLGLVSPAAQVGLYNRAFQLVMSPLSQIRGPAQVASIPALSRVRDDSDRYLRYLLRAQATIGYMVIPLVAVLAAASQPIVGLALGDQWLGAAPIVSVLSVAGALQLLASVASWVFTVSGMGLALQQYSFFSLLVKVAGVCALAWLGAFGVAVGYALAVVVAWPVAVTWALKGAGLKTRPVFAQSARMIGLGLAGACLAWILVGIGETWPPIAQIAAAIGGVMISFAAGLVLRSVRHDIYSVIGSLKTSLSSR